MKKMYLVIKPLNLKQRLCGLQTAVVNVPLMSVNGNVFLQVQ